MGNQVDTSEGIPKRDFPGLHSNNFTKFEKTLTKTTFYVDSTQRQADLVSWYRMNVKGIHDIPFCAVNVASKSE